MTWLIFTLISAFTLSLSRILQRIMLKDESIDSFSFSFVFPVMVSLVIFAYTLLTGIVEFPNLIPVWFNVLLMIIFYGVGSVCIYQAYKSSPASEVSIIFSSSSAWSVLAAVVILGETLSSKNMLGVLSIIFGICVINYQKSKWKIEPGHIYALLAALMFGFAFSNDVMILKVFHSVPPYVFLAFILPSLAIFLYRPSLIKTVPPLFSKKNIGKLMFTAAIYAISSISMYTAYRMGGKASSISPIQQTNVVMTVILSYFVLNEKDKLLQKIIGTILVFSGAIFLI